MASRSKARKSQLPGVTLPRRPTTVEEWLEARLKAPVYFEPNEAGEYVVPAYGGVTTETIIQPRPLVPATPELIAGYYAQRKEQLAEPEVNFSAAKRELLQVVMDYKRNPEMVTVEDVIAANQKANVAQCRLNSVAKYPRWFREGGPLEQYDLHFDWYRRAKIPEGSYTAEYGVFPWKAMLMQPPVAEEPAAELEEEEEGEAKPKRVLTAQQKAIIASRANARRRAAGGP